MSCGAIALFQRDISLLRKEAALRGAGEPQPHNIRSIVSHIARGNLVPLNARNLLSGATGFAYHFDPALAFWAIARRPYVMMIWGLSKRGHIRDGLARLILRRATQIVVNEQTSGDEVRAATGREATVVPFLVDTEFFSFAGAEGRSDFLFCPGSNGRDADILLRLADKGHRVVWLNNDADLIDRYGGRSPHLSLVTRPSFAELRRLYQTCRTCILPIGDDTHAAGQTTTLEAIACGAPVVITDSRTSSIFENGGLVAGVVGRDVAQWERAMAADISSKERRRRRDIVHDRHNPERNRQILAEILGRGPTIAAIDGGLRHNCP